MLLRSIVGAAALVVAAGGASVAGELMPPNPWEGPYVGFHVGGAVASDTDIDLSGDEDIIQGELIPDQAIPASLRRLDLRGAIGGVQAGYNWFNSALMLGVAADVSVSMIDGSASETRPGFRVSRRDDLYTTRADSETNFLSTLRARIGYLAKENLLLFATGGVAIVDTEQKLTFTVDELTGGNTETGFSGGDLTCRVGRPCLKGSASDTTVTWTAGAGFELLLSDRIALKADYLYIDLGDDSVTATGTEPETLDSVFLRGDYESDLHIARVGLNFLIGDEPEPLPDSYK